MDIGCQGGRAVTNYYSLQLSGCSATAPPATTWVVSDGTTMRWVAPTMERIAPELCVSSGLAQRSPSRQWATARMKWVRPAGFRIATSVRPSILGVSTWAWPSIRRSAGRTNSSNDTKDDVGFPGRPNNRLAPRRPQASGFPGLISTFQNSIVAPASPSAPRTKSCAPAETPPMVSTASKPDEAFERARDRDSPLAL